MSDPKLFYTNSSWDIETWVDVIAVEYESLLAAYDFNQSFLAMPDPSHLKLLDLGCGTAIFPTFLDPVLTEPIVLEADLLDISAASLDTASSVLKDLKHFQVGSQYQTSIETAGFEVSDHGYDLIWAIHSFTTVNTPQMAGAIKALLALLKPTGYLMIYQLTSASAYQRLHGYYRSHHPQGENAARYMEFEDTQLILHELGIRCEVFPLQFEHQVRADRSEVLQMYLRKVVLDDSVETAFFGPILIEFLDSTQNMYRFRQSVDFALVPSPAAPLSGLKG